jgi:DNA invertase Pin-like site-specific DNA recombinase
MADGVNTLHHWLKGNVQVICITLQIDLSGTIGQIVGSLIFGLAEIELQNQKERQAAGIAVAKARGVYKGRKKGTTKVKPARAKELLETLTVTEIARLHNCTERTVYNALERAG